MDTGKQAFTTSRVKLSIYTHLYFLCGTTDGSKSLHNGWEYKWPTTHTNYIEYTHMDAQCNAVRLLYCIVYCMCLDGDVNPYKCNWFILNFMCEVHLPQKSWWLSYDIPLKPRNAPFLAEFAHNLSAFSIVQYTACAWMVV